MAFNSESKWEAAEAGEVTAAQSAASQQSCKPALFYQQDYPRLFVQELDTSPTRFGAVRPSSSHFTPRLCLSPPLSSSPLSPQLCGDPVCIVSLPFPASWRGVISGVWSERSTVIAAATKMQNSNFFLGRMGEAWSCLTAVSRAQQVDALIECVFFLILCEQQRVLKQQCCWRDSEDTRRLERHMDEWHQWRRGAPRPDAEGQQVLFFSLQSRGLHCPALPPHPVPAVPRPEECRPCQAYGVRGCFAGASCPYSHLSFAQHFALLSSNVPVQPSELAPVTPEFRPVLALLPPPSAGAADATASSSAAASTRFVVCVPFPRLPWCGHALTGLYFQRLFGDSLRPLPSCALYRSGSWSRTQDDESVDWPRQVAVLDSLQQVDELLECVMWMWEDAHLLPLAQRDAQLHHRLLEFRERKGAWTGDRDSQLFSLEMRGVSMRCPPVPPRAGVPAQAVHPAADASTSSSSSSSSSGGSRLPPSPPPSYSSSKSSSPSPKVAQPALSEGTQAKSPSSQRAMRRRESAESHDSGSSHAWTSIPAGSAHLSERFRASPLRSPSPPSRQRRPSSSPAAPASELREVTLSQFAQAEYSELFVQYLDTTPVSFGRLPFGSARFCPSLCATAPFSTSPLSRHALDPLFVVCFSFPAHYFPLVAGKSGQHHKLLADVSGVERSNLRLGEQELLPAGPGPRCPWAVLKAVGGMQQLDLLMEGFFRLMQRLQTIPRCTPFRSERWQMELQALEQELQDWKQRRRGSLRADEPLYSLQSRGLRCPPLRAPVAPPLSSPDSCRPCQSSFTIRGCQMEAHCPDSHLPFAQHFGLLSSNVPAPPEDIPSSSEQFSPVLALLPPSSSSSSSAAGGRYVLCVPFPRLSWVNCLPMGSRPFQSLFGSTLLRLPSMQSGRQYECGQPSTGWLNLVAELDGLDSVDEFMECVMWMVEDAAFLFHGAERDAELDRRLGEFRERKRAWTGDRDSQLFSLEMRGVSMRCPPVPPRAGVAPPVSRSSTADASTSSSSSSSGGSRLPQSPPPPYPSSESSSPPRKPARGSSSASALLQQADWQAVLSGMKTEGLSVSCSSDVLLAEFSSSSSAFLCCRSDCVFACIPIPASSAMRSCVLHQQMPDLPDIATCETDYGLDVYVPRLSDEDGRSRNAQQLPWLNITVKRVGQQLTDDTLDEPLVLILERCRRAVQLVNHV